MLVNVHAWFQVQIKYELVPSGILRCSFGITMGFLAFKKKWRYQYPIILQSDSLNLFESGLFSPRFKLHRCITLQYFFLGSTKILKTW